VVRREGTSYLAELVIEADSGKPVTKETIYPSNHRSWYAVVKENVDQFLSPYSVEGLAEVIES